MKSKKLVYFDIETTGLCHHDKYILAALHVDESRIYYDLDSLAEAMKDLNSSWAIATYNGESYYGGFDIPFLRTLCIKEGRDWFLRGKQHLDLYPLVKKFLNTKEKAVSIPSKSSLKKDQMKALAECNGMEYKTIEETYNHLVTLSQLGEEVDWLGFEKEKCEDKNSLQGIYQMLFDPEGKEKHIKGEDVPRLFKEGKVKEIAFHCKQDVERLKKVAETILPYFSNYEVRRGTLEL